MPLDGRRPLLLALKFIETAHCGQMELGNWLNKKSATFKVLQVEAIDYYRCISTESIGIHIPLEIKKKEETFEMGGEKLEYAQTPI